jgi:hypothetical protein
MRKYFSAVFVGLLLAAWMAVPATAVVEGDYVEVRSADVYTGSCFANAEVGLVGNEAILAWRIRAGSWNGVNLDGLSVVAVVKANATLGDPFHSPYPARSVLIFEEKANSEQRKALERFARAEAGKLLDNVVRVEAVPIELEVGTGRRHGRIRLEAGTLASIETRGLNEGDHLCGNEEVYYPPLTRLNHSMPAVALLDRYQGTGLGVTWSRFGKRSAFVGTFSR